MLLAIAQNLNIDAQRHYKHTHYCSSLHVLGSSKKGGQTGNSVDNLKLLVDESQYKYA